MGARPSQFTLTSSGPLRLYSTLELLNMPEPDWLVEGVIPLGGFVAVYGQPGAGKSFVAIDLALSVAAGVPWQGKTTKPGFVLYISAEGGKGISKRVLAWHVEHDVEPGRANIGWLLEAVPVNVDSEAMERLFVRLTEELREHPVLIVIDTLARCFEGDENTQLDMNRFVAGVDWLRHQLDCTVVVIHHTNLSGLRERGNTAFRGAADTMLMLEKDGKIITVSCTKQRDEEEFTAFDVELVKVEGTTSAVVLPAQADVHRQGEIEVLVEALRRIGPCPWQTWIDVITQEHGIDGRKLFAKYRREMTTHYGVGKKDGRWFVSGTAAPQET